MACKSYLLAQQEKKLPVECPGEIIANNFAHVSVEPCLQASMASSRQTVLPVCENPVTCRIFSEVDDKLPVNQRRWLPGFCLVFVWRESTACGRP